MATDPRDEAALDPRAFAILNLLLIHRLANGASRDTVALIRSLYDDIVAAIARFDPAVVLPRYRADRLARLVGRVRELVTPAYAEAYGSARAALVEIGRGYGRTQLVHLRAVLGAGSAGEVADVGPTISFLKALVDTRPVEGHLLKDWFAEAGRKTAFRVEQQVKLGVANGETLGDIVRRVRGRSTGRAGQFSGGVLDTSTREAESIVRTAVNDICNSAGFETFRENADIAPQYEVVATLDARTTLTCRAYDGKRFRYSDAGARRPPFHVGCRSVIVPVVDWKALGVKEPPENARASEAGPFAGTHEAWLRSQPVSKVDAMLGPTRGRLFREGRMSLNEFVRSDGSVIRVADLPGAE